MVFLFRDKSFSNIFFLIILLLGVHVPSFILHNSTIIEVATQSGFISLLLKPITVLDKSLHLVLYLLIVLVQALRLNIILNNNKMFPQQHFTVAMAYILLTGFFKEWAVLSPALIANFFILWVLSRLVVLNNNNQINTHLFNTGIIAGITFLACNYTMFLLPLTILALLIIRPFRLTEWIILLLGLLLPFYFLTAYLYLTNQLPIIIQFLPIFSIHVLVNKINLAVIFSLSTLSILFITSTYVIMSHSGRMVIHTRKNWGVIILLFLLSLPATFIYPNTAINCGVLCIVPLAALAGSIFSYPKQLVLPNLLFWLCITTIILNTILLVKK